MTRFRWTPTRMEQLEAAIRFRRKVEVRRGGSEHIVVASRMTQVRGRDALAGVLAMTGEELLFVLDDIDHFQVLDT